MHLHYEKLQFWGLHPEKHLGVVSIICYTVMYETVKENPVGLRTYNAMKHCQNFLLLSVVQWSSCRRTSLPQPDLNEKV